MRWIKSLVYLVGAAGAGAYLLNPGAGLFEILPDTLPIVGHVDEAAMLALLLGCIRRLRVLWGRAPVQAGGALPKTQPAQLAEVPVPVRRRR
ncbi:MAG: DUF1232 domain-containing protein [Deltaproteobacteria bacterium]|nr:MAG: DUF1232 domain-containing protein [Deltaproteobacteria bacterium]